MTKDASAAWDGMHVGRSWTGHPLEDDCPCTKAPCGLAIWGSNLDCPQHAPGAGKTIRQGHKPADCPGAIPNSAAEDQPGFQYEIDADEEAYRATPNREAEALDLLRRIREWDHLPLTGDGPYWMREIDKVLRG